MRVPTPSYPGAAPRHRARRWWLAGLVAFGVFCSASLASADERLPPVPTPEPGHPVFEDSGHADPSTLYQAFSPEWTGAYVGLGLQTGLALSNHVALGGFSPMPSLGVFAAFSSPFHIAHGEGSLHHQTGTVDTREGPGSFQRTSLRNTVLLHPLFAVLILGSGWGYTLGQIYGLAGLSIDHVRIREGDRVERFTGMGWHVGAGFDTHIRRPWAGQSWWIGPQWRFEQTPGPMDVADYARHPVRTHVISLRVSYRRHGLVLRHGTRPDAP